MTRRRWEEFLDKFYCWQDQYGNRLCDYGEPCDLCQTEQAQKRYEKWLKKVEQRETRR